MIKKIFILYVTLMAVSFTFMSCGEDRTYQYEELTERNHWMTDAMKSIYLWGDSIDEDEIAWKSFFADPQAFFSKLTAFAPVTDRWSWCQIDTLSEDYHERGYYNHVDSYGMDFFLMTDPTGETSRQYARVSEVIPGSPADRCGLERGDFIGNVDGVRITSSYLDKLVSGKSRTLEVAKLDVDFEENRFVWTNQDTLYMDQSEYVEDVPFPVREVFDVDGNTVEYLMCNRLTSGPVEKSPDSQEYVSVMDDVMEKVRQDSPKVLVLDLRLCNYGSIELACRLASYIVGPSHAGEVFAKTIYSDSRSDENSTYYFDSDAGSRGLSVEDVFIITSDYTSGAAEWLLMALRNTLSEANVFVVGLKTAGQYVMTEPIATDYKITLNPVVAFVADANGSYDYSAGFEPDEEIDELNYVQLFPYGDKNEVILSYILEQIELMY